MGAPYIYDISRLRVKDLHSVTYIYVVRRLRVNGGGWFTPRPNRFIPVNDPVPTVRGGTIIYIPLRDWIH